MHSQRNKSCKPAPQCEHIKTNGVRCGSPSLRSHKHCFYHQRAHDLRRLRHQRPEAKLHIPLLEDANAIQMAIQEVADAIAEDRIDNKRAGLLLFAFQTAASNLKNVDLEPQQLRSPLEDPQESAVAKIIEDMLKELEEPELVPAIAHAAPPKKPNASEPEITEPEISLAATG